MSRSKLPKKSAEHIEAATRRNINTEDEIKVDYNAKTRRIEIQFADDDRLALNLRASGHLLRELYILWRNKYGTEAEKKVRAAKKKFPYDHLIRRGDTMDDGTGIRRCITVADGHVMCRRPGRMVTIMSSKEWLDKRKD